MKQSDYISAYLHRIGASAPSSPNSVALAELCEKHLMTIPFENIDIHLKRPISLGAAVFPKIIDEGRGGTCTELNSAFEIVLREMGFDDIYVMGGRAFEKDKVLPSLAHFVLIVSAPEPYLVDMGFLRGSRLPLRFDLRTPQSDPEGEFQFVENLDGTIDLLRNGAPQYRLSKRRMKFSAFPKDWWAMSAPDVPGSQKLMCSILTADGRYTMLDQRTLIESGPDGSRRIELSDRSHVISLYRETFGLPFNELPLPCAELS